MPQPLPPLCSSYLLLLGGVREPLFLLTPMFTVVLRPRLLRTCFSIQARRFVRLLCSDSTIRGHGLHSAMSRAAMAIARPTCGESGLAQCLGLPTPGSCFHSWVLCWLGEHSPVEGKERLASHLLNDSVNCGAQALYCKVDLGLSPRLLPAWGPRPS